MSNDSTEQQIEYEEVVENVDMEAVLEGTRWEDSFDKDEPFAKEFVGMLGAMGGYALGEILGRGVGGMVDRELEAMDKRMNEDTEEEGTEDDDDQQQSESSGETTSDQDDDRDQQDASVETTIDQDESPSLVEEDENESADEGPDEDVSGIGGDSI